MRIFKQGCERFTRHEEMIPTVTSDNIERVVCNLVHKIRRKFYEVNDQYQDQKPKIYGPLEGLHNKERCEACRHGLCKQQMLSCEYEQNREQRESVAPAVLTVMGLVTGVASIALMYFANK